MRIGELAKISGLAPSRIRFYEASGLIKSVERKANGYRDYAPDTQWVLEIITGAQAAGFSLEEIRQLMPMNASGWQHEELLSGCLLYTSPSPRDRQKSRMPSSA